MQAWRAVIGLVFVLAVLYLPRGLAGLAGDVVDRLLILVGRAQRRAPAKVVSAGKKSA